MKEKKIYRISFYNQGNIYELHAHGIQQSSMYAFVEVEGIIFGERSSVVVDPAEGVDDGRQVVAAEIVHQPRQLFVGARLDQSGHRALVADLVV